MRKLQGTCSLAVDFAGFLHQLQLASYDLAYLWRKKVTIITFYYWVIQDMNEIH